MTSDTSDIPGPIPLTRAGLEVRPVGVIGVWFVLLGACQCLAHAVPYVRSVRAAAGHETHEAPEEQ